MSAHRDTTKVGKTISARRGGDAIIAALIKEEEEEYQRDEALRKGLGKSIDTVDTAGGAAEFKADAKAVPEPGAEKALVLGPLVMRSSNADAYLSDMLLLHVMHFLPAESVCACRAVSTRWRDVGGNEHLWKSICKAAIRVYHPPPTLASQLSSAFRQRLDPDTAKPVTDDAAEVSLSVARQRQIDQRNALRRAEEEELQRLNATRENFLSSFKRMSKELHSYRIAYRHIPMVKPGGVYTHKTSYVRNGVEDMFHKHSGLLLCVYHRTFRFLMGGQLLYAMIPGSYTEALKEMRREEETSRSGMKDYVHRDKIPRVLHGWYRMEGNVVRAEVYGPRTMVTKWTFQVGAYSSTGVNNQLTVLQCVVCEHPADEGYTLASLDAEAFWWVPVPAWQ